MRPSAAWIQRHGYGTAFGRLRRRTRVVGEHREYDGAPNKRGRPQQIRIYVDGRGWAEAVQRLVWMAYRGEIQNGLAVVRTCDHRGCIRVEHLELTDLLGAAHRGGSPLDITGERFGFLVAIERFVYREPRGATVSYWRCRCDCGEETETALGNLRAGQVLSCGCLLRRGKSSERRALAMASAGGATQ